MSPRARVSGIVLVALIIGAGAGLFQRSQKSSAASRIPPPPAVQSKAITAHLADEVRRGAPGASVAGCGRVAVHHVSRRHVLRRSRSLLRRWSASLDSSQWRWRYYRALIQAERGGGEPLVENLRRVVNQASDFGPAWQRLGDALFKAGKYDEAREAWERASMATTSDANQPAPRHLTEVPLSAYANVGLARIAIARGETMNARGDPGARRRRRSAVQLGAAAARRRLSIARPRGRRRSFRLPRQPSAALRAVPRSDGR